MAKDDVAAEALTDDLLKDAIKNTEGEISDSVFEEPESEGDDKSPEEMGSDLEGRGDLEEGDEADEGEGDEKTVEAKTGETKPGEVKPGEEKPDTRKTVPLGELIAERKLRQDSQAELKAFRENSRQEFNALNSRLDAILAGQVKPAPKQETTDDATDIFADPIGTLNKREATLEQKLTARFVNASLSDARDADEKTFDEAYAAITALDSNNPADRATVQKVWNAPNPGRALVSWHKQNKTLQVVGNDPDKWLADKLEEKLNDPKFLGEAIKRAREKASGQGSEKPNTITRLPSLNGAGGSSRESNAGTYDNSDKAISDSVFANG
jgi:hypothetical protein